MFQNVLALFFFRKSNEKSITKSFYCFSVECFCTKSTLQILYLKPIVKEFDILCEIKKIKFFETLPKNNIIILEKEIQKLESDIFYPVAMFSKKLSFLLLS